MGHVWLIGMMGTGKTTVGAIVAEQRELPLHDTDATVMATTGRTIPELFADSETTFRDAERRVIADLATAPDSVIATGGGAVLDPRNVETMRGSGRIVLLTATTTAIRERVGDDDERPLLADDGAVERIAAERRSLYAGAAELTVDTSGRNPASIAEEVIAWLDT
jgi:shikimate kinase